MNLQQLEYIVAVDRERHFARAAESCYVTQPTLSMMIQKLEDELGIKIFDRSRQPVRPTKEGEEVLVRARKVLRELESLQVYARELKGEISGTLHLGVIPTLAPYLLPLFLRAFMQAYPMMKVFVKEMVTDEIIARLKAGDLDTGLLAGPLQDTALEEHPLFYEEFFAYAAGNEPLPVRRYLLPSDIDLNKLWLLEEGHCLRNQVFNFCELKRQETTESNLHYEAGSIETLINMVDQQGGITIIPQLALNSLREQQRENIRAFIEPAPVREISLAVSRGFPRTKLLQGLYSSIRDAIPPSMQNRESRNITAIR